MLEIAYGNVTQEQADWMGKAAGEAPDGIAHYPGTAEPWVSQLVASFVIAIGARRVLECGSFMGGTSAWIKDALHNLGGGELHLCEIDPERMAQSMARVGRPYNPRLGVSVIPHQGDVLRFLAETDLRFDLAWVDDNHEKEHVEQELALLIPRMAPGGLILGHDVWGSCDLQEVFQKFGGYSINLPRLGAAGGIGIIQVPHPDTGHPVTTPWKQLP